MSIDQDMQDIEESLKIKMSRQNTESDCLLNEDNSMSLTQFAKLDVYDNF